MPTLRVRPLLLGAASVLSVIALARLQNVPVSSGYPWVAVAPGKISSELWRTSPSVLERTTDEDAARLARAVTRIDAALALADAAGSLLDATKIDDLDAEARARIRDVWWSFLDPLLELDAIKRKYEGWYGVDFRAHPALHARAFALSHAALSSQVAAGHRLLALVAGRKLAQSLFDEASPGTGVPRGSFTRFRNRLAGARDQSFVPVGAEWYRVWLARHLAGPAHRVFDALVTERTRLALAAMGASAAKSTVENKLELLRSAAYASWFPLQKEAAEWAGDTRFVPETRRLVQDADLAELQKKLEPGDIILERRNWYLSNVGLPGFWPHAALYVGTAQELASHFDEDPDVRATFGVFSEHLATKFPAAWRALGAPGPDGHQNRVLEAVSEGVVVSSLEHSCAADYVGALRPRMTKRDRAVAMARAFSYFGRPYDFDFDFATDDAVVCSELVMKAYEPSASAAGIRVPFVVTAGRRTIPPTEIVRAFARDRIRALDHEQLEFVAFLDGRERERRAVWGSAEAFAASAERPKWDIAQP